LYAFPYKSRYLANKLIVKICVESKIKFYLQQLR